MEKEKDKEEKDETEMLLEPEFSQSSNMLCTKKKLLVVKKKKGLCCVFRVIRFGVEPSAFGFLPYCYTGSTSAREFVC